MTMKTSRVDLKALATGAAVVGALAFAPAVHAQQFGPGQPGGVGQQEGYGQRSQMGQPGGFGQQDRYGQMGQTGGIGQPSQMGQTGGIGQPSQMGQPSGIGQPSQMGQSGQTDWPSQMGQSGQTDWSSQMGQPGQTDWSSQMGQPGAQDGEMQRNVNSESIRRVQEALKEHEPNLKVDGRWGPQTSSAVQKFQQEQGMNATGKLDSATLQALGVTEQFGLQEGETGQDQQQPRQQ